MCIRDRLYIGEIKKHNLRTLKIYDERRDFISKLIIQELSEFVTFKLPDSGLAIWLEIFQVIDMSKLMREVEFVKISISTGADFSNTNEPVAAIRLGFANLNNDEISTGIMRLRAAFSNQEAELLRA